MNLFSFSIFFVCFFVVMAILSHERPKKGKATPCWDGNGERLFSQRVLRNLSSVMGAPLGSITVAIPKSQPFSYTR